MFSKIKKVFAKKKTQTRVKVSASVRDYSNEAFFVEKAAAAKAIVEKYGYPKNLGLN